MKKLIGLSIIMFFFLTSCSEPIPPNTIDPAVAPTSSEITSMPNQLLTQKHVKPLVPQAELVNELLNDVACDSDLEEIPFERISEIIPNPEETEIQGNLVLHTYKLEYFGDGGGNALFHDSFHVFNYNNKYAGNFSDNLYRGLHLKYLYYNYVDKVSLTGGKIVLIDDTNQFFYLLDLYSNDIKFWGDYTFGAIFSDDLNLYIQYSNDNKTSYLVNPLLKKKTAIKDSEDFSNILFSKDLKSILYTDKNNNIVLYNLLDGIKKIIFETDNYTTDDYIRLLNWKNDSGVYFQKNGKQYLLDITTGKSRYMGEFMFDLMSSPDGRYLAFNRVDYDELPNMDDAQVQKYMDEYLVGSLDSVIEPSFIKDRGTIVIDTVTGKEDLISGEYAKDWFYMR